MLAREAAVARKVVACELMNSESDCRLLERRMGECQALVLAERSATAELAQALVHAENRATALDAQLIELRRELEGAREEAELELSQSDRGKLLAAAERDKALAVEAAWAQAVDATSAAALRQHMEAVDEVKAAAAAAADERIRKVEAETRVAADERIRKVEAETRVALERASADVLAATQSRDQLVSSLSSLEAELEAARSDATLALSAQRREMQGQAAAMQKEALRSQRESLLALSRAQMQQSADSGVNERAIQLVTEQATTRIAQEREQMKRESLAETEALVALFASELRVADG